VNEPRGKGTLWLVRLPRKVSMIGSVPEFLYSRMIWERLYRDSGNLYTIIPLMTLRTSTYYKCSMCTWTLTQQVSSTLLPNFPY
jgi:hypothetical protein